MPPITLEFPFGLEFDLSFWQWFFSLPTLTMAKFIFVFFGWTIIAFVFFKAGAELWADYREEKFGVKDWEWVVLAVDVPELFIQSPKAVEQIFAHLSGVLIHPTISDVFWTGKKQKWFSFEIVSIEGYIQFLVRTEREFRDLVEAAIYAQYTEAEITEVEDYVEAVPDKFPNEEYEIAGVEFNLAEEEAYPIRTYPNFEYTISKDSVFSDPMAAILENFTRIGRGENLWMQIIIEPVNNEWKKKGIEIVKELMNGSTVKKSSSIVAKAADAPRAVLQELSNIWYWNFENEAAAGADKKEDIEKITPGTKNTVEAIEEKVAKIGFKSKLRIMYAARKEVFSPNRCVEGFIGSMNQFHTQNRNALAPCHSTKARYDRQDKKSAALKNSFVKVFKNRAMKWKKCPGKVLNIEELATIWHFPLPFVKAPMVKKAGAKRGEPPVGLPMESTESPLQRKIAEINNAVSEESLAEKAGAPENLPYA